MPQMTHEAKIEVSVEPDGRGAQIHIIGPGGIWLGFRVSRDRITSNLVSMNVMEPMVKAISGMLAHHKAEEKANG